MSSLFPFQLPSYATSVSLSSPMINLKAFSSSNCIQSPSHPPTFSQHHRATGCTEMRPVIRHVLVVGWHLPKVSYIFFSPPTSFSALRK